MKNRKTKGSVIEKPALLKLWVAVIGIGAALVLGILLSPTLTPSHVDSPIVPEQMYVCFSPDKSCQHLLLRTIDNAKKSILVQAYSFTDQSISEALIAAKKRGVSVEIILDKSNRTDKNSRAHDVSNQGIPVFIDSPAGIAHNKVMIIDDETVITGSYNFSKAAYSRNAENLLILHSPELTQEYIKNWKHRKTLSN